MLLGERMLYLLDVYGVPSAGKVFGLFKKVDTFNVRWDEDESDFPARKKVEIWNRLRKFVSGWLRKNYPDHPSRPLFDGLTRAAAERP